MYTAEILLENTKNTNLQRSMKKFLILCMALFSLSQLGSAKETTTYRARVTYYSNDGIWGNRVACQKAKTAKEGISVAAHPNFKFGTMLTIPALKGIVGDGEFVVQDRGPAVTRKVAARGKTYVFDVYVSSFAKIHKLKTQVPDYVDVIVHTDK
jgi:hypothetical protein